MKEMLITILIMGAIVTLAIEPTKAEVSPRIDIFVGTGDQGFHGISDAFDSINNRFLVVTTDGGWTTLGISLYGQLVNTDGTLYGDSIVISPPGQNLHPQVTFDPENRRFLVVWYYSGNVYGQLINSDGSLFGNNFIISPIYHYVGYPVVQFDTINKKFFVVWQGPSLAYPSNVYGQFVNPDGSLHGSIIQITDYDDYAAAYPKLEFDSNNGRFLTTWANQFDGYIYGRLINSDGTFYGSEITIGYYGFGSYGASLSFDPVTSRFLQVWGDSAQLINADGSLYGTEISFFDPSYAVLSGFNDVVFDTSANKFLVAEGIEYPYIGIAGQLVSPDGSLSGQDFKLFEVIYSDDREGHMGSYIPSVAFGSAESGSLVVYMDIPYLSISGIDIFGNLVKLDGNSNQAPILDPIGSKTVNELELLQFTVTATDPNGDSLSFSATGLPSGATFDPVAGTFSWTPDATQAGSYPIHFEVSDNSLTDSEDITIEVKDIIAFGTILGVCFNDINGNKIRDSDEEGLSKWTIRLEGYDNVIQKFIRKQVFTDANGNYNFNNLNPGDYTISEKLKPKWMITTTDSFSVNIIAGEVVEFNFGNMRK